MLVNGVLTNPIHSLHRTLQWIVGMLWIFNPTVCRIGCGNVEDLHSKFYTLQFIVKTI